MLAHRRCAIGELLDHGKALGQIRKDVNNDIVADLLYGAYAARLITGHGALDRKFAEQLVAHMRGGIETRKG
jgi:hypothetical protein